MNIVNSSFIKPFEFGDIGSKKEEISEPKKSFTDVLKDSFWEANALKKDSDLRTTDFLAGRTDNLHEVMIAGQKAEVAISFVTEVRNRLVEGYQEFSRMQL